MTTSDAVPLIDLRRSLESYRGEATRAFSRVLESQHFILGEEVAAFERELAAWLGVEVSVGCGSGSDAIALALQALDVGPGDEVVTTPFTFIATVSAILRVGARPVLVDVDPQTGSIGYGPGGGNLRSTGVFDLRRRGNRIAVTVFVTHEWSDDGYNFDKDTPFYDESQVLERHKNAKPFPWKATWEDVLKWEVEIIDPFTPNATRRMIGFDTMPPDQHISP